MVSEPGGWSRSLPGEPDGLAFQVIMRAAIGVVAHPCLRRAWSPRHTFVSMRRVVGATALKGRPSADIDDEGVVLRKGQAAEDDGMKTGKSVEFGFESGLLTLADVQRLATDMWSDLAFDEAALERLKRDGLMLDGVRLTGPSPFALEDLGDGQLRVTIDPAVAHPDHVETLLDLWRVHFVRGLRPGSLAA